MTWYMWLLIYLPLAFRSEVLLHEINTMQSILHVQHILYYNTLHSHSLKLLFIPAFSLKRECLCGDRQRQ